MKFLIMILVALSAGIQADAEPCASCAVNTSSSNGVDVRGFIADLVAKGEYLHCQSPYGQDHYIVDIGPFQSGPTNLNLWVPSNPAKMFDGDCQYDASQNNIVCNEAHVTIGLGVVEGSLGLKGIVSRGFLRSDVTLFCAVPAGYYK